MITEDLTRSIITKALIFGASDIHFIPQREAGFIKFRVDGILLPPQKIPLHFISKIISHLKFISGMDIGEKRRPQNKRHELFYENQIISMRISTFPSSSFETLVIRIFPQSVKKSIYELSLVSKQADRLIQLMNMSYGLLLVCGPTGVGKTTTLYTLLEERIQRTSENVITIEDPVEQERPNLLQMEINEPAGLTYQTGIKSVLRQDPDILMIGEIRDRETALAAIRAALSGHFVISTLHSHSTVSGIKRLIELGVTVHDLKEVLRGIVSQRLVHLTCPYCGNSCSVYCKRSRKKRRAAIFEILATSELSNALISIENNLSYHPLQSFEAVLIKNISLGFIPFHEWNETKKGGFS